MTLTPAPMPTLELTMNPISNVSSTVGRGWLGSGWERWVWTGKERPPPPPSSHFVQMWLVPRPHPLGSHTAEHADGRGYEHGW